MSAPSAPSLIDAPRGKSRGASPARPQLAFRGQGYPARSAFFALRFQRLLLKTGAAFEVGAEGLALLALIVLTEDSKRYREPPRFWNTQIENVLGWSWKQLDRCRKACVDAGWLHYEAGGKHRSGVYWVIVPTCYDDFDDGPLGETPAGLTVSTVNLPAGRSTGDRTEEPREVSGRNQGRTFLPDPRTLSPTPPAAEAAKTGGVEERVLQKLKTAGIALVRETLDQALAQGLTLDTVEQVVDYACSRPAAWGPGALRLRLISRSAHLHAPHEGWPPPAPAERERQVQQRIVADTAAAQETRDSDAGRRAELKQLELDFGQRLDALSSSDVERLLDGLQIDLKFVRRIAKGKSPATLPAVRPQLLRALAERSAERN